MLSNASPICCSWNLQTILEIGAQDLMLGGALKDLFWPEICLPLKHLYFTRCYYINGPHKQYIQAAIVFNYMFHCGLQAKCLLNSLLNQFVKQCFFPNLAQEQRSLQSALGVHLLLPSPLAMDRMLNFANLKQHTCVRSTCVRLNSLCCGGSGGVSSV